MTDMRSDDPDGPARSTAPDAPDAHGDADADGDAGVRHSGPTLPLAKVAVLVVACSFLAGALTWFLTAERPPGEGSVDVGFLQDMTSHHEQGLEMAAIQMQNGENATVLSFATDVMLFQAREIGLFAAEMEDWGSSVGRPDFAMGWMGMAVPWRQMPGLVDEAAIDDLRAASGAQADALFLEMMSAHHLGGVPMADYAAENAASDDVRRLAEAIARVQRQEVAEYRQTAEREGLDADIPVSDLEEHPDHDG